MANDKLVLSKLGHTWLIDIDGTIVKHNGYKIDGHDSLLPGAKDFFDQIPNGDTIILLTSRTEEYKKATEDFLVNNRITFDRIIYGLPYGERIIINDNKPSGLCVSKCVSLNRDDGLKIEIEIDNNL